MPRKHPQSMTGTGHLDFGPEEDDGLVPRTLEFIHQQLPAWRDDPRRPKDFSEKGLNSSLCDFLDVQQRKSGFAMVRFKHEAPQFSGRTVDIGVHGVDEVTTVGNYSYGIYEPFLVIECKRLPAPGGDKRKREYVSGYHENDSPTGGIQRFKLGLHGGKVEDAAMIGYVEEYDFVHWHGVINSWIDELVGVKSADGTIWTNLERLAEMKSIANTTANCDSSHSRHGNVATPVIRLRHIWIQMQ